eukprot:scaffold17273_cov14-Tisochrysis_lutea.AAC.1
MLCHCTLHKLKACPFKQGLLPQKTLENGVMPEAARLCCRGSFAVDVEVRLKYLHALGRICISCLLLQSQLCTAVCLAGCEQHWFPPLPHAGRIKETGQIFDSTLGGL